MKYIIYLLPLAAGIFVCLQSNINGYWQTKIGIQATVLINGWVVAVLSTILFFSSNTHPIKDITSTLQPAVFLNGFFGFSIVTIAAFTFPKLGAASVLVTMTASQILMGLFLDQIGFLELPQRDISTYRIIGLSLIILGVFFTTRG